MTSDLLGQNARINAMLASTSWTITSPLRWTSQKMPRLRFLLLLPIRMVWWTITRRFVRRLRLFRQTRLLLHSPLFDSRAPNPLFDATWYLWPAIAYLAYVQFRNDWRARQSQALTVALLIGGIWLVGALGRSFSPGPGVSNLNSLRPFLIDSPLQLFTNVIGIFGSPSKGLFVYAPVLLLSLYAIPRTLRTHPEIAIFALLLIGGTLAMLSVWKFPADEVWGPRYMHTAIAPLLVCIAAARPRFHWCREAPLLILAAIGLMISFLGAFYYYGVLDFAAIKAGQNTMEWLTGDRDWNQVEFDGRLFRAWLSGGTAPILWTPKHLWVWAPPHGAQPWRTLNLRDFCEPQSAMLHLWHVPKNRTVSIIFSIYVGSLLLGPLLLAWAIVRILKEERVAVADELAVVAQPSP